MHNILITTSSFAKNDPGLINSLEDQKLKPILNPYKRKLTETEVKELIIKYKPLGIIAGVEPLSREVLNVADNLKVISRCGIGMDSVDIKAAKEFGIAVKNTPDAPTIPVAELTLGLILTLLRQIHISDSSIRNDEWKRPMGNLLNGKTVGIIGCGRIGSYVAKLLFSFGCTVFGYDIVFGQHNKIIMTSIEKLLRKSDIVTLHLSYSNDSNNFMNSERIRTMKKGAILVNTARGELIDEDALYEALKNSQLAGAAIDCFKDEPYKGRLKELKNVVLTAHIGSYASEGRLLMEKQASDNLLGVLNNIKD
ncbi:Hydroxyacid dehydrogenase [Candidatus Magnetomoraceae bacterium gMMP-15]